MSGTFDKAPAGETGMRGEGSAAMTTLIDRSGTAGRPPLRPRRLWPGDVLRVGGAGLRARPTRVFLSALGIAIGIAAMVSVVGISTSSREDLNRRLASLGTNLLTVGPGQTFSGTTASLPDEALSMISRIGPVTSATAVGQVSSAKVYRNDRIPAVQSGGIAVLAARTNLPATLHSTIASGRWLNASNERYPAVVLGAKAAEALGIHAAGPGIQVWLGGQWFVVVGLLDPMPLAPELDWSAMIGWPVARSLLGFDGHPTTIYTRAHDDSVEAVAGVLAATANPENPNEVKVSRPSDALAAKQASDQAFNGLLLGLGAVALLVGGVGVANTMVISVLERRAEIGLRRSLGATRGQIRVQFLAEALLLCAIGGAGGVFLGTGVTAVYAASRGWPTVVPVWVMAGGLAVTLAIGAFAGLYPAIRASRLSPTEALATP
jgi:putative ABC transport system permease protein